MGRKKWPLTNAKSEERSRLLKEWEGYIRERVVSTSAGSEELARLRSELKEKGEATKLKVYGLPIPSSKDNRKRKNVWWIPESDWESAKVSPLRLSVTSEDLDDWGDWDDDPEDFELWIFDGLVYLALAPDLTSEDVLALINQERNTRRLALEKAHALQAMAEQLDKPRQRVRLPQEARIEVWQRDKGRCVECDSQENLEFDHIIPFAMGGSNTARNLQMLCGDCNRRKGMTLG